MSCTVMAIPYALAWVVAAVVKVSIDVATSTANENESSVITNFANVTCDDVKVISEATLMEKSLETPFMDKEILIKTLEEHGVKNITEEFGKIKGEVDTYSLSFEKMEADKPYFVTITYLEQNNPEAPPPFPSSG